MAKNSVEIFLVKPKSIDDIKRGAYQTKKEALRDALFEIDYFGEILTDRIVNLAPVDEGEFKKGFRYKVRKTGPTAGELRVTWTPHGRPEKLLDWIVFGTGIYGPMRKPIRPVKAPFLQWQSKDGRYHRAKSVRGMRKRNFLRTAWAETKIYRDRLTRLVGKMLFEKMFNKSPRS